MRLQMKMIKIIKKLSLISDHPYQMLITGGSGSGKTNALLNLRTGKYTESLINEI